MRDTRNGAPVREPAGSLKKCQPVRAKSGINPGLVDLAWPRKAKCVGMESGHAKKLKQLEDENRKLKHVAELTLDNRAL